MAKKTKKKKSPFKRFLHRFILFSSLSVFLFCVVVALLVYSYLKPFHERAQDYDLARIDDIELPSIILDRNGKQIGRVFVENRSVISYDQMPENVINCLVSQEDQRFWSHRGVDWIGLIRMVYLNAKAGKVTQGASTLTMQLSRNAYNLKAEAIQRDESGKERKLVEIFLAHRIGSQFSSISGKKYIIENYLNRVPFGHGYYGIRSASLGYYGKEPMDLQLEEAASIIACIKNPSAISPLRNQSRNKTERNRVFHRMREDNFITKKELDRLLGLPIKTNPKPLRRGTSHLYERIGMLARETLGEEAMSQGGFKIHTTIDLKAQNAAERSFKEHLAKLEASEGYGHARYGDYKRTLGAPDYLQGALIAIDPRSGEVLSHVGGRDYNHTQFDFVEKAKRPLGTALLPFLYAYAFENNYDLVSRLKDEAIDNRTVMIGGREGILGEWGMEDMQPRYEGEITTRRALEASKIAASVRLGKALGVSGFSEYTRQFGFDFPEKDDLLSRDLLGWVPVSPKEMVQAYSVFANGGSAPKSLFYIKKIESAEGLLVHLASKLEIRENTEKRMDPAVAFQVDSVLRGTLKTGNLSDVSSQLLSAGFQGGAKTGTLYDFSDGWAIAYNGNMVTAAWVGFQKGRKGAIVENGFAKKTVWPVVSDYVSSLGEDYKNVEQNVPSNIISKEVCRDSGLLATRYCFEEKEEGQYFSTIVSEYFVKGRAPTAICTVHMGGRGQDQAFVDRFAPNLEVTAARPLLSIDPVKPQMSVVMGIDPYGAVKNSEEGVSNVQLSGAFATNQLILNDQVLGEEEAIIQLPKPRALRLKIISDDLQPLVPMAIAVE